MRVRIRPTGRFGGTCTVPGDKSVGHRGVLLGAMARGRTVLRGLSSGHDVESSLGCVERLGVRITRDGHEVVVDSPGREGWRPGTHTLDAGNSGTTARLLMGMVAPCEALSVTLTGDASLARRPMKRASEPLQAMGARIDLHEGGTLPARIDGRPLTGTTHHLAVSSAQVKTALLLAGLGADGTTRVTEPHLSRDHTERMLPLFGARVESGPEGISVTRTTLVAPQLPIEIPGDPSSAIFFAVAAAICGDGEALTENVLLNPTRTGAFEVLHAMGADVRITPGVSPGEPRGALRVGPGALRGVEVSGAVVPRLIDDIPALAIAAACAEGTTVFRDAAELRVKESDRIDAVVTGLRAMGAEIEEFTDGFAVLGGRTLHGAHIDARMDHRIAMAFTLAGLVAEGETLVDGAQWVDTSFPGFFGQIAALTGGAVGLLE